MMSPASGSIRRLVLQNAGAVYGVGLAWSPDSRSLYFSERSMNGEPLRIYRLVVADGSFEQVTRPSGEHGDMYPSLSPDGAQLAFIRQARSLAARIHVLLLEIDGRARGEPQRVTTEDSRIAGLDWMPSGKGIVFSSDHYGRRRLWMIRRGWWGWRGSPEPLGLVGEDAFQPSVADADPMLVYSRRYWPAAIWRVDLQGGVAAVPPVKIAASSREDLEPAWSPDGQRIAFISTRTGHTEIWVCQADGTGATQLTAFAGPLTHAPSWSPDGSTIAFHSGPERSSSVFLVPSGGGTPKQLTPTGTHSYQPAWSRDGRRIYFASNQGGSDGIWSMSVEGGTAAQVTAGPATLPQVAPDGDWLYFRRGGVWRAAGAGGPEQQVVNGPVGTFAVGSDGIYFDRGFGDYAPPEVHFLDFKTGRTRLVARFDRRKSAGLSLSPDGQSFLVPLNDRQSSEILVVGRR